MSTLDALAKALGDLPDLIEEAGREVAPVIREFIEEEFHAGEDPNGSAWADLAASTRRKGRSWPPLTDTGNMAGSVEVESNSSNFITITVDAPAEYHQYGTRYMPQRQILPDESQLPEKWEQAVRDAAEAALDKRFKDA